MYLHKDRELFFDIVNGASQQLRLPLAVVEKDYYVTMILKLLAEKNDMCVFKGGTSLTKCFHVLNRFSEDIDITFTQHLGESRRKSLKYKVLFAISQELSLPITNWENIESDKDYNCYIFSYEPIDQYVEQSLFPGVKLETALGSYAFPTELKEVGSYVYDFLQAEDSALAAEYGLNPFIMKVQSLSRTFADKVFALCDYYMEGKSERYSRHLYDLYKLRPLVALDGEFKCFVQEVRFHRAKMKRICPSAREGVSVPDMIRQFCDTDFYHADYDKITNYFINDPVSYDATIKNIREIADSGVFDDL